MRVDQRFLIDGPSALDDGWPSSAINGLMPWRFQASIGSIAAYAEFDFAVGLLTE
tara:strand:- start:359 stop:523 length:165 start_codon:yes stop_codon:yes gene_type:complete